MTERMTKGEREDLQRLIRQREKVQKSAAEQHSTELLADFENQIAAEYKFDDDEVWAAAEKAAEVEVRKAQERVATRCQELGIPAQFAPSLTLRWSAPRLRQLGRPPPRRASDSGKGADCLARTAGDREDRAGLRRGAEPGRPPGLTSEAARLFSPACRPSRA